MPTPLHIPAQPGGAQEINAVVAMVRAHGSVAYFASVLPLTRNRVNLDACR